MNEIQLSSTVGIGRGVRRQVGRELDRIGGSNTVGLARIEAKTERQVAKVEAASYITQRAMQGAAFISQVEQQLAQAVPLAASRLEAIGNMGTLGLTMIITDSIHDLRAL